MMGILREVAEGVDQGRPADATLAALYRRNRQFGSRDRRLFSGTVFSFFRWKGWLDAIAARDARAAAVFAHLLDTDECHPAVRCLGEAAGIPDDALRPLGPLPLAEKPGMLHKQVAAWTPGIPLPTLPQLFPSWFAEALEIPSGIGPEEYANRLTAAFQSSPPTWVRLRPSREPDIAAMLVRCGIEAKPHPRMPEAAAVPRGANLQGLSPHFQSGLEIQDLASQATGLVCAPKAGESWWDACSGAGGKALHLADLLGPSGRILATDIRPSSLEELRRRAAACELGSLIQTREWDGSSHPPPAGDFDGVLLDAPCSGLGTWHRNPDARWRLRRDRITALAHLQLTLLNSTARRVKPGGTLVYATCTLTREENTGVLHAFLAGQPGFALDPFPNPMDGKDTPGFLEIHPWDGPCNGMFLARMTHTADP